MNEFKWPRIWHFSFSENLQNDDRMLQDDNIFTNKNIVVTLKLDGEGTGLSKDNCHARSLDSRDHPSRHWVKGLWGQIRHLLDPNITIFGEILSISSLISFTTKFRIDSFLR